MIYSPSIEILFGNSDLSFNEKIKTVHELGFSAFEFWGWWEKDLAAMSLVTQELGIQVGSMCAKNIPLADPSRRAEFLVGLQESLAAAKLLGCPYLIVFSGDDRIGVSREEHIESIIDGLKASIPLLEGSAVTLILEPLNALLDHKGYFLNTSAEAARIVKSVNHDQIKFLFDVYHQQITEGNLIPNISQYFEQIGYFHIADHPGRFEPGTGEINYMNVLGAIQKLGYTGYIGLEYKPSIDAEQSLLAFKKTFNLG
jgi:hydroxypyruvate isomerase